VKNLIRYLHLWGKLTANSFAVSLASRFSAFLFLFGKVMRFGFVILFIIILLTKTQTLAGYQLHQVLFFFLTFNVIDTGTQLFFREAYRFRPLVISGDFDLVLVKPMNPLFRALAGGADPLDLVMLIPYIGLLIYVGNMLGKASAIHVLLYILLLLNGFVIATGFHILVLALTILTAEIDHAIMIYRDLTSMGRVPVDIYREPLRGVITFVVPVGIMMTFPAKAMLGLLAPKAIILSFVIGFVFVLLCLRIWNYALTRYASASS